MSFHHTSKWHWEHYPTGNPHAEGDYRIADEDDDYVQRVHTEVEARKIVQEHNAKIKVPDSWHYD